MSILDLLVQIATIAGVVIAAYTIYVGGQINRRELNVQVFTTYVERYERIMSDFPDNAYRARFALDEALPPRSEQLTLSIFRYLNLCSEEFYLWQTQYIDHAVWCIWEDELVRILRSPMVRREWPELRSEFVSFPAFLGFVERAQASETLQILKKDAPSSGANEQNAPQPV